MLPWVQKDPKPKPCIQKGIRCQNRAVCWEACRSIGWCEGLCTRKREEVVAKPLRDVLQPQGPEGAAQSCPSGSRCRLAVDCCPV